MVYFIQQGSNGPIKIGRATNPVQRLRNIQVANPWRCRLLGTVDGSKREEAAMHARFSDDRMDGEWFRPSPRLYRYIVTRTTPQIDCTHGEGQCPDCLRPHVGVCPMCLFFRDHPELYE